MQLYRITFYVLGGLSIAILAWAMTRDRNPPSPPTAPATVARTPQGKGSVGLAVVAMTLDIPEDAYSERSVWFRDVALASGVDFKHFSGVRSDALWPTFVGSGVGAIDFDKDGFQDLYFGTGTPFPLQEDRHLPVNRCYRNLGDWKFMDVTASARVGHNGYTTGIAVGDYDNDGFSDLFVAGVGPDCLYRNQGDGTFELVTREAGLSDDRWGMSATFADFDQDGLLDLYVCNYAKWNWEAHRQRHSQDESHQRNVDDPAQGEAETDLLYRNRGDGTFENVSSQCGFERAPGRSLGVVACDLNADDRTDFVVTQARGHLSVRLNRGDGTFEIRGLTTAEMSTEHVASVEAVGSWHGVAKGASQMFFTGGRGVGPALGRFDGDANYQNDPAGRRIEQVSAARTGWGCAFADFNLDGADDLILTNGSIDAAAGTQGNPGSVGQLPQLFKNTDGMLLPLGHIGGSFFTSPKVGRGLATADLDNDGDTDVVISHLDGHPAVLRNSAILQNSGAERAIQIQLVGSRGTRDALGASVTARLPQAIHQFRQNEGSYLSAHDRRIIIATAGAASGFEIRWPDGLRSEIGELPGGHSYVIIEPRTPDMPPTVFLRPLR